MTSQASQASWLFIRKMSSQASKASWHHQTVSQIKLLIRKMNSPVTIKPRGLFPPCGRAMGAVTIKPRRLFHDLCSQAVRAVTIKPRGLFKAWKDAGMKGMSWRCSLSLDARTSPQPPRSAAAVLAADAPPPLPPGTTRARG